MQSVSELAMYRGPLTLIHLDDDPLYLVFAKSAFTRTALKTPLKLESFSVVDQFKKRIQRGITPDIILLDMNLNNENADGSTLTKFCRSRFPESIIIICSNLSEASVISQVKKLGADNYISKLADKEDLVQLVFGTYEIAQITRRTGKTVSGENAEIGRTLSELLERIPFILNSAARSVMIRGENGTGKRKAVELFSSCLPKNIPFQSLKTLKTSKAVETFLKSMKGKEGWLFIEDLTEIGPKSQNLILTFLNQNLKENKLRFITTACPPSHPELDMSLNQGILKKELYFKLNEIEFTLPPLRNRNKEELIQLIRYYCGELPHGPYQITGPALGILTEYPYKNGNIYELKKVLVQMTEFSLGKKLTPLSIPEYIYHGIPSKESKQDTGFSGRFEWHHADGSLSNEIRIPWENHRILPFQTYCNHLLVQAVRRVYVKNISENKTNSLRSISRSLNISRDKLTSTLKKMLRHNEILDEELLKWLTSARKSL